MDKAQILPAVDVDYDSRFQCGWFWIVPEKEFFSIASKGHFNKMSQAWILLLKILSATGDSTDC